MYSQVVKDGPISSTYDILRTLPVSGRITPEPQPAVGNNGFKRNITDSDTTTSSNMYESLELQQRSSTRNTEQSNATILTESDSTTVGSTSAQSRLIFRKLTSHKVACPCFLIIVGALIVMIVAVLICTLFIAVDRGKLRNDVNSESPFIKMNATNANLLNLGKNIDNPAPSCAFVLATSPTSRSGQYWVKSSSTTQPVSVFCNMELFCGGHLGGWTRIVKWDMRATDTECPSSLEVSPRLSQTCRIPGEEPMCKSTLYTSGIPYSGVCGRVTGFIDRNGFGFREYRPSLDSEYVDGVSLTYGPSPRKHIWTFAGGLPNTCVNNYSFIENDYFCESINNCLNPVAVGKCQGNPLWNSEGCRPVRSSNTWCSEPVGSPWFYKQLEEVVFDSIEMRLCRQIKREFGDIVLQAVEIYVR